MSNILIVKTGTTDTEIVSTHGDYEDWFLRALPVSKERISIVHAYKGEPLPNANDYSGILLTGSVLSVTDEEDWMLPLGRWAVSAADNGTAVLAVCFGHQLIGEVLGGKVVENERGIEVGAVNVSLSEDGLIDPLFEGLPGELDVNASHGFVVSNSPSGVRVLAGNDNTYIQAFSYGDNLRAVQFHPEMTTGTMKRLLEVRGYQGRSSDSNHGAKILQNWVNHWVGQK